MTDAARHAGAHAEAPQPASDAYADAPAAIRAIRGLSQLCGVAAALMIVAAVCITCQMIFVRYVMNESTIWQTELVVYLVIGATLLGLPYVQKLRGHVNVDLLPLMLPPPLRVALAAVVFVASIVVIGVMFWYGFELWHMAWSRGWRSDTVWGAQLWAPYLAMPVGFGALILQLGADLWGVLSRTEAPFEGGGGH
jgi:TRAP-type C4-dicarboxylate transport system permease small subunit